MTNFTFSLRLFAQSLWRHGAPPLLFVLAFLLLGSGSARADEKQTQINGTIASVFTKTSEPSRIRYMDNADETADKLFDGNLTTKWSSWGLRRRQSTSLVIEFHSSYPIIPKGYIFTTGDGEDLTGRNPQNWTIKGKLNEDDKWTVLDSVTNDTKLQDENYKNFSFSIDNDKNAQYQYFRLELSGVSNTEKIMQMSEFRFIIPISVSNCVVSTKNYYTYNNGSAIDLSDIIVKDAEGNTLTEGTDYTVELQDNNHNVVDNIVNAGKNYYVIKGQGNYYDSLVVPIVVLDLNQSSDGSFLIKNDEEWQKFAQTVNSGLYLFKGETVKLGASITTSTMVGTQDNMFCGTFDGNGNTLTVNYSGTEACMAPFRYVNGATIKNLHVAGTISTSGQFAAGIVANATACTIEKCQSSVAITSSVNGDGTHGGLVAVGSSMTINDCVFDGSITGSSTTNCGGFIGLVNNAGSTITNSLQAGTFSLSGDENSYTFARNPDNVTITNSYYLNALGSVNSGATQVTAEQLSSGEVAYALQSAHAVGDGMVWGQTLTGNSKDKTPVLTTEESKHVYKVTYQYDDGVVLATQYSNATMENLPDAVASRTLTLDGNTFTASTTLSQDVTVTIGEDRKELKPTINDMALVLDSTLTPTVVVPEDYKGTITYISDNEGVVSVNDDILAGKAEGDATITAKFASTDIYRSNTTTFKVTVVNQADLEGKGTDETPYLIKTAKGWDVFTQQVAAGNTSVYAKLANDIESVSTMAGTSANQYAGTFDGQGHTLNADYTFNEAFVAPFRYVKGATIKNLNVAGTIHQTGTTTDACYYASTLTGSTDGVTLEKCVSSVALTFDISGDVRTGGLVGNALSSTITINDCAFIGSITQPSGSNASVGGFIGWGETDCKADVKNSYVDMTLSNITGQNNFVRAQSGWNANDSKFENCYYTLPANTTDWDPEPSTKVTKEQIKNGYVANALQGNRNELVWGQNITGDSKDEYPVITTDTGKRVYKASFMFEGEEKAAVCANTGKTFPELTSVKFVSTDPADYTSAPASENLTVALNLFNKDDGNWLISNADDWNTFATYCTKGNYRMTADIAGVTTMAGTNDKPFSGTFDGQGYTLNVNITGNAQFTAPFSYVGNATIKDLNVTGTVYQAGTGSAGYHASGLVGAGTDKCTMTIERVVSSVAVSFADGGDMHSGGFVGHTRGATINVTDCAFTGSFTQPKGDNKYVGGIIGWGGCIANIKNTYVDLSLTNIPGMNSIVRSGRGTDFNGSTFSNNYYTLPDGIVVDNVMNAATQVTRDQMQSGYVAYMLQNGRNELVWGQALTTDVLPRLTSDIAKRVLKNVYDDDSENYDNYVVISEDKGNKANISANADVKANVKLVRTFAADTWNTLVLPFELSTEEVNEVFGKDTKVAKFTGTTDNTIELNYDETGTNKAIEANTPVMIRVTSEVANPTFSNRTISSSESSQVVGDNGINFVGSYDALYTIQDGEYFISGTNLWKSQGSSTIKATRAYFTMPSNVIMAKPALRFNAGSTTGISGITQDSNSSLNSQTVYTLSGQKVADSLDSRKLPSGVYIVGGKKIVIK